MVSRRRLLRALGPSIGVALAGCGGLAAAPNGDEDASTPTSTPTPTPTSTSTPTPAPVALRLTDGSETWTLVTAAEMRVAGEIREGADVYRVPVTLTDAGADSFVRGFEESGALDGPDEFEMHVVVEGEVVFEANLGRGLVDAIESGEFTGESFVVTTEDRQQAERVREAVAGN